MLIMKILKKIIKEVTTSYRLGNLLKLKMDIFNYIL